MKWGAADYLGTLFRHLPISDDYGERLSARVCELYADHLELAAAMADRLRPLPRIANSKAACPLSAI
jgi:hypothetical protein